MNLYDIFFDENRRTAAVNPTEADRALTQLRDSGIAAFTFGEICSGDETVELLP